MLLASNILCHRGLWFNQNEQNSRTAISRAVEAGYGIEIDIRVNSSGTIVVAHDHFNNYDFTLKDVFEISYSCKSILAINIKCDGMVNIIKRLNYDSKRVFFFDMSFPEKIIYEKSGLITASRVSEYERPEQNKESVLWVDCFESIWYDYKQLNNFTMIFDKVILVSPELHQGNVDKLRLMLKSNLKNLINFEKIYVCTDFPLKYLENK